VLRQRPSAVACSSSERKPAATRASESSLIFELCRSHTFTLSGRPPRDSFSLHLCRLVSVAWFHCDRDFSSYPDYERELRRGVSIQLTLWPFQLPGSNDRANPTRCSRWRTKLLIPTVKTWIREALVILSIRRVQTRGRNINRTCLAVSNRHTNFLGRFHCWNVTKQQSGFTDFEARARLSGTRAASLQRW
jgi:hypothetical protein